MSQLSTRFRISSKSASHLIRFFMYNFVGALLPLAISLLVHRLGEIQPAPGAYAPEILVFGIMICATALGDLTDEAKIVGSDPQIQVVKGILIFGGLAIAAIFGVYQFDAIIGSGNAVLRTNIANAAIIMSGIAFAVGLSAEVLIAKIRGEAS